jgi:hypothetical protein
MNAAVKSVAWLCVFSVLLWGCYSSATIFATGNEKEQMYSGTIQAILTKDGMRYEFDFSATISNNAIVGAVKNKSVSIPLSDVRVIYGTKFDAVRTVVLVLSVALCAGVVAYVKTAGGIWQ